LDGGFDSAFTRSLFDLTWPLLAIAHLTMMATQAIRILSSSLSVKKKRADPLFLCAPHFASVFDYDCILNRMLERSWR
jgi:hypothetical protein